MFSLAIALPIFLLPISLLSLAFLACMWMSGTLTPSLSIYLSLIALSSAAAGAVNLATNASPVLNSALEATLECLLSGATLFIFRRLVHYRTTSSTILNFLYVLAAVLIVCELVSSVIPHSLVLLSPVFSAAVRLLSVALLVFAIYPCPLQSEHSDTEKHGLDQFRFPRECPIRGSSPATDTWPFPTFLTLSRSNQERARSPQNTLANQDSSPFLGGDEQTKSPSLLVPLALTGSQIFALLCASVKIVIAVIVSHTTKTVSNQDANSLVIVWHLLITHAVCRCVWAVLILTVIYVVPPKLLLVSSVQVRPPTKRPILRPFLPENRTPKSSFSRFLSPDSASEYLSVADPFASIPPPLPPPPVQPVGLDLDEVDNRHNHNGGKGIRVQYRFPAPRSRAWRKPKSKKKSCSTSGKWTLDHKGSAQSLNSCPPLLLGNAGRADGTDQDKDGGLRDEAILSQLLLQSLDQGVTEDHNTAPSSENRPITTLWRTTIPRALYIPPRSRWSSNSTVKSPIVRPSCSSAPQSRKTSMSEGVVLGSAVMGKVSVDTLASKLSVGPEYDGADLSVASEKS